MAQRMLFIHIPKTAGTSFRLALAEHFGLSDIERDYGATPEETTELVKQHLYNEGGNKDVYEFIKAFQENGRKLLVGHFRAQKYSPFFSADRSLTFIREPLSRIVSEFRHLKLHKNYKGLFTDFIQNPAYQNKQAKYLSGIPWQAFALTGITERYADSLKLFEKETGINLDHKEVNKSNDVEASEITSEVLDQVQQLNSQDFSLYSQVLKYFDARLDALSKNHRFFHHSVRYDNKHFIGWAFLPNDDTLRSVDLYINETFIRSKPMNEYVAILDRLNAPRRGHLGFRLSLKEYSAGDTAELRVGRQVLVKKEL